LKVVVLGIALSLAPSTTLAEEVVISDDGRQIQLNGDGTWIQLSRDRYATNAEGRRVRLRPDGTWTLMTDAEAVAKVAPAAGAQLTPLKAASESTLHLAKVEILRRKIKRAKSIHAETRTVYHLGVRNDTEAPLELSPDLKRALKARSSSGGEFEILTLDIEQQRLAPGERTNIRVEAEGSPQWFGVKYLQLEVAAGALGNADRRLLSKSMDEVDKRSVDHL
jgi:hypothetical protein